MSTPHVLLAPLSLLAVSLVAWSAPALAPQGTYCAASLDDRASGACLSASSAPTLGDLHPLGPELNVDGAGNVGIGTTAPGNRLDVIGGAAFQGGHAYVRSVAAAPGDQTWGAVVTTDPDHPFSGRFVLGPAADEPPPDGALRSHCLVLEGMAADASLFVGPSGNVGLGTSSPVTKLEVAGDASQTNGGGMVRAAAHVDCHPTSPSITRQFQLLHPFGTSIPITVTRVGPGEWELDFWTSVIGRHFQVTPGAAGPSTPGAGFVTAFRSTDPLKPHVVVVRTRTVFGAPSDTLDFFVAVF